MPSQQNGFALVIVLFITAVLVTVVVEFIYGVYISTTRAGNFKDMQRAGVLVQSSVEMAEELLQRLLEQRPYMTMDEDGWFFTMGEKGAIIEVRVVDEASKLSLEVVFPATGEDNTRIKGEYTRLIEILQLEKELVDTLADWIDGDDEPRMYGAEDIDYYSRLPYPYSPKNGRLDTVDEILLVKGYTPDVYREISPYVTVYTDGLVNINTAPAKVIMALSEDITEEMALKVISHRRETPFSDRSDIMKVPGFETIGFGLQDKITVKSNTYRIFSKVRVGEVVREVEAVVELGGGILYWREM